jgi:hypothetical protein
MNFDLDKIMENEEYVKELKDYLYCSPEDYRAIPFNSMIRYIDRDGKLKRGGFFQRFYDGELPDDKRILMKPARFYYATLYPVFYHVFYKTPDTFNRSGPRKKNKYRKILVCLKDV